MGDLLEAKATERTTGVGGGVVVELPLGETAATFDLEKAVCSHGLFMMAPNHWDPVSKGLLRPLHLDPDNYSSVSSVLVRISHPSDSPKALHVRVYGSDFLSPPHRQSLLAQVRRMLRLSEADDSIVKKFHMMHREAKERGFGRVFRSPTLFEDMVKCILLCNCHWSRTLSMARSLCELQLELQSLLSSASAPEADNCTTSRKSSSETFIPSTPAGKESKRKVGVKNGSKTLAVRFLEAKVHVESDDLVKMDSNKMSNGCHIIFSSNEEDGCHNHYSSCQSRTQINEEDSTEINKTDSCLISGCQHSEGIELHCLERIGNFPCPEELASLDEKFLAKRCSLGYRASRILNLAKSIVEGKVQLRQLEEACSEATLSNYTKLNEQLKEIDGFGPFTCANVLMCMGFYHAVPTDSETIRHLKQVHARNSSIQTVQKDVEAIYGKYAPFQFLAYWSEVWHFYEEWFGKLSEMPDSDYKLITAANMKPKKIGKSKRTRTC
ncbi:DNA-(apurinic or apyrimidinic site) lyase [Bertholletia excelsa]